MLKQNITYRERMMANFKTGATVLDVSSAAKNNYPGTGAFPGQQNLMLLFKILASRSLGREETL